MQFMNDRLEKLVKNLRDDDCKYLTEEFGSKSLELLQQIDNSKRFSEKKLRDKKMLLQLCKRWNN